MEVPWARAEIVEGQNRKENHLKFGMRGTDGVLWVLRLASVGTIQRIEASPRLGAFGPLRKSKW